MKLHEVAAYVRHHAPDAIISCAAFTNVDGCETNREAAFAVNALGARNLAMAAEEIGAKLVHVSTDYVFSGDAAQPVWEYDLPAPRSVYGKTKLLGEQYVQQFCTHYFIVRTAWLYGYAGNNFVKTMLRLARQNGGVTVVDDQLGNPTNAADLAHEILNLLVTKEYGVYHCTGEGVCSWCEFAAEIIRLSGVPATGMPLVFCCLSGGWAAFSIRLAPHHHGLRGLAAAGAYVGKMLLRERHAPAGKPRLFLHHFLAGQIAAPHGLDVAVLASGALQHLVHGRGRPGAPGAVCLGAGVQAFAQRVQQSGDGGLQVFQLCEGLFPVVTAHQHAVAVFNIPGPDFQTEGHALHLVRFGHLTHLHLRTWLCFQSRGAYLLL